MRTSRVGTSGESGFTLIELGVVVLIMAIFIVMAYPRVSSFLTPEPIRAGAKRLAAAIRKLRNYAVAEGQVVRIRFQLPKGKWRIEGMDAEGNWRSLADAPIADGALPGEVLLFKARTDTMGVVVEGEVPLHFFPDGSTERAFLYLRDESRREERTLEMFPLLNRVDIHLGQASPES